MINKLKKILQEELKKNNHDNSWLDCIDWVLTEIEQIKEKSVSFIKVMEHFFDSEHANVFPLVQNGTSYGSTKKKQARISIAMPREVCDSNLKDLRKWKMFVLAYSKEEFEQFLETIK